MEFGHALTACALLLAIQAIDGPACAQTGRPDYSGAWRMAGEGRKAKLVLEQEGRKLTGAFESSDGSQVWDVTGSVQNDKSIRLTRYIPISELGNTPEPALSSVFRTYGARDKLGFLLGKVVLRPTADGLAGYYTRINAAFHTDSGKLHKVEEVKTDLALVRARDLPDLKVTDLKISVKQGGPTGEYWDITANIANAGGSAPGGPVTLELERTARTVSGREPDWQPVPFARFDIPALEPNGRYALSWSEIGPAPGAPQPIRITRDDAALRVNVDPDNRHDEQSKRNNRKVRHRISCEEPVKEGTPRGRMAWVADRPAPGPGDVQTGRYKDLLEAPGDKAEAVLCVIRMEAQARAKAGGLTVNGTNFLKVLADRLLRGYLRAPNPATGLLTVTELGDTMGAPRLGLGVGLYVPKGMRDRYPGKLGEWLYPATQFFIIGRFTGRHVNKLPLIDVPFLVGSANTDRTDDADFLKGGKNLSNVMHWATGLKYWDVPKNAMRELFIGYEYWHMEGFDTFGEDAINDLIAEEAGRALGVRLVRGDIKSAADLGRKLNADFYETRAWVGALLRERQEEFDKMILSRMVPQSELWFGWRGRRPTIMAPWGSGVRGRNVRQLLMKGMPATDVVKSEHVQHLIQIYTLIYEATEWEKAHGAVGLTPVMRKVVKGGYNDQFKAAAKEWGDHWEWRP